MPVAQGVIEHEYEPRGGALKLLYSHSPEVLIDGPAGTGKTRACLEKIDWWSSECPGVRALIVRKTRESCTESVLVTFEEKVLTKGSVVRYGPDRAHRQRYKYPNGSEIVIGGLDKVSRVMSAEYDLIYVPEATEISEDDCETLTTRLRNGVMPYQQLLMDCNPASPTHWLNQRCVTGQTERVLSRHEDNPSITESYLTTLQKLQGVRRKRLYEGQWAAQEGLVYEFDAAVHMLPRFEIPKGWRRIRAIDFGYTNPFVCQWWAVDPDGRMYMYREIYKTQTLVSDHAQRIIELSSGENIEVTVADHDAEDRATLASMNIFTVPAEKGISTGIQAVQKRLEIAGDGKPRLFLLYDSLSERDQKLSEAKKPTSTREEFDSYAWPIGASGRELKEAPTKIDDHGLDSLRYAVAWVDEIGRVAPAIKWI